MKHLVSGLAVVLFLAGCASAPQQPIALTASAAAKPAKIGIAMSSAPTIDTYFPGANCLLCYAAASVVNSSLTAHTKTLPAEDLQTFKTTLSDALRKKGADVVLIDEDIKLDKLADAPKNGAPNTAAKDFRPFKARYAIDKLLVVEVQALGIERTYAAYVPTSDPKAIFRGTGYLVNLENGAYEWYLPVSVLKSSDGQWDEPPKFPGLTNAYFQAVELAKDSFVTPFLN